MDRSRGALIVAVLAVVIVRAAAPAPARVPLVAIPQGISLQLAGGAEVFVRREGTLTLTAFRSVAPSKSPLRYCPPDPARGFPGVFVTEEGDLFTEEGAWVFGPSKRDLDRVPLRVDDATLQVEFRPGKTIKAEGRSRGEVPGELFVAFERWLSPRSYEDPVPFCEGALG